MELFVDNRVRVKLADLTPVCAAELKSAFTHRNPDFAKKLALKLAIYGVEEWIVTWKFAKSASASNPDWITFPRGGLSKVLDVLDRHGETVEIRDRQMRGQPTPASAFSAMRRPLMPHQVEIVRAAQERKTCLIKAGTGSGKTTALIALASELKVPTLVIVHSVSLAEQWVLQIKTNLGIPAAEVGSIRGSSFELRPITVATVQSLSAIFKKYPDKAARIKRFFGAVFADEVQFFAAGSFYSSVDPIPALYRIGASADERRKDKKDFLISDLFGPRAYEINHAELVANAVVAPVEVRLLESLTRCDAYNPSAARAPSRGRPNDPDRVDFLALKRLFAADEAREALYIKHVVAEVQGGAKCFVLVHEREHCQAVAARLVGFGVRTGLLLGGAESKAEFRATLEGIKAGKIDVGVGTYKSIGTGIDAPTVSVGFAVTPIGTHEQFFGQVRGRFCRKFPGREGGRLYMVMDPLIHGNSHIKNIARWNGSARTMLIRNDEWVSVSSVRL